MFKSYTCEGCGEMFTFPDAFDLPLIDGKPAHHSCAIKHHVHKHQRDERIEYLCSLTPTSEEESQAIQAELFQLMGRSIP